ncbi:MAG: twin-arginine translocation signal domain-containing protein [Xanthobacteraceae bacterium]
MKTSRRSLLKKSAAAAATLAVSPRFATAQAEAVRIGVVYDLSGPFAAGGSAACAVGAQIAISRQRARWHCRQVQGDPDQCRLSEQGGCRDQ